MPTQRRHGLSTLLMTGDPDARGALVEHLLAGRKTAVVRPVADPAREPLERAGDLVLLVDAAGRSLAVAVVQSTDVTTLRRVEADTRRADDPDHVDAAHWAEAQLARWRAAGLLPPNNPTAVTDLPVVVIRVRVVGLEDPSTTPDPGGLLP